MVFFNQPQVPGLSMQVSGQGVTFTLMPASIDASIERIAVCVALDSKDPAARLAHAGAIEIRNGAHRSMPALNRELFSPNPHQLV